MTVWYIEKEGINNKCPFNPFRAAYKLNDLVPITFQS